MPRVPRWLRVRRSGNGRSAVPWRHVRGQQWTAWLQRLRGCPTRLLCPGWKRRTHDLPSLGLLPRPPSRSGEWCAWEYPDRHTRRTTDHDGDKGGGAGDQSDSARAAAPGRGSRCERVQRHGRPPPGGRHAGPAAACSIAQPRGVAAPLGSPHSTLATVGYIGPHRHHYRRACREHHKCRKRLEEQEPLCTLGRAGYRYHRCAESRLRHRGHGPVHHGLDPRGC
eukprot:scaffold120775_cov70-Phaeocystis_antarctica.AAC.1